MYMTRDYLKVDPWTAVIEMINNEYGTELQPYSTQLVSIESLGGTKTKIKIKTNISKSETNTMPKLDRDEFYYDRIDLRTLYKGGPVYVMDNVRLPLSTYQVMGMLDQTNETVFSFTDLEATLFSRFNTGYSLVAKPESLRFIGSVPFTFENSLKYDLNTAVVTTEFPKANTWQFGNDGNKITGNYLFTGYDFTQERAELISAKTHHKFDNVSRLRGAIKRVTGQDWICEGTVEDNNLCYEIFEGENRVRVVYNGTIDPAYTARTDMSHVLVLELSSTRCANVSGFLLLHYN